MSVVEERFSIIPMLDCDEATEIWDALPSKEDLTDEDGIALAMVTKHKNRYPHQHDDSCFTQRPIN